MHYFFEFLHFAGGFAIILAVTLFLTALIAPGGLPIT
jgi:hypothetical protein